MKYPIEILMDNHKMIYDSIMKMNDCSHCGEMISKEKAVIDENGNKYHQECREHLLTK